MTPRRRGARRAQRPGAGVERRARRVDVVDEQRAGAAAAPLVRSAAGRGGAALRAAAPSCRVAGRPRRSSATAGSRGARGPRDLARPGRTRAAGGGPGAAARARAPLRRREAPRGRFAASCAAISVGDRQRAAELQRRDERPRGPRGRAAPTRAANAAPRGRARRAAGRGSPQRAQRRPPSHGSARRQATHSDARPRRASGAPAGRHRAARAQRDAARRAGGTTPQRPAARASRRRQHANVTIARTCSCDESAAPALPGRIPGGRSRRASSSRSAPTSAVYVVALAPPRARTEPQPASAGGSSLSSPAIAASSSRWSRPSTSLGEQLPRCTWSSTCCCSTSRRSCLIPRADEVLLRPATRRIHWIERAAGPSRTRCSACPLRRRDVDLAHPGALRRGARARRDPRARAHHASRRGLLYWWHLIGPSARGCGARPGADRSTWLARRSLVGFLGIVLTFAPSALYSYYIDQRSTGGSRPLDDQGVAGRSWRSSSRS